MMTSGPRHLHLSDSHNVTTTQVHVHRPVQTEVHQHLHLPTPPTTTTEGPSARQTVTTTRNTGTISRRFPAPEMTHPTTVELPDIRTTSPSHAFLAERLRSRLDPSTMMHSSPLPRVSAAATRAHWHLTPMNPIQRTDDWTRTTQFLPPATPESPESPTSSQFSTYIGDHRRFPAIADRQMQEERRFLETKKSKAQRLLEDTRSRLESHRPNANTNSNDQTPQTTPRRPIQTLVAGRSPSGSHVPRGLMDSSPTESSVSLGALSQSMTLGTLSRSMTDISEPATPSPPPRRPVPRPRALPFLRPANISGDQDLPGMDLLGQTLESQSPQVGVIGPRQQDGRPLDSPAPSVDRGLSPGRISPRRLRARLQSLEDIRNSGTNPHGPIVLSTRGHRQRRQT